MADAYVGLASDGTGKKVDTSEIAVGAFTVERQRINLADPATAAAIASILNANPSSTEYGLTVRPAAQVRNGTNYSMALPILTTATDAVVALTGYKGGAAVAATATPAVVTTGKTYRITAITLTYVAIATAGLCKFTLRANLTGVGVLGSPAVAQWIVGGPAAAAGVAQTVDIAIPDGIELAAGTGIALSIQGLGATGAAATVGYGHAMLNGYEY